MITLAVVMVGSATAILLLAIAAMLIRRELEHRRRAATVLEAGKAAGLCGKHRGQ